MSPSQAFKIHIDSTQHTITDSDQEAAALLRLAQRDPVDYDLFLVDEDGVERRVRDKQIINLKRGLRFVTRRKVHFTIDGASYSTFDDDQEVSALLRLAGLEPADFDLARIGGPGEAEVFTHDQVVTLREGDSFVTAKRVGGVA